MKIKNILLDLGTSLAATLLISAILAGGLILVVAIRYGSAGNAIAALRGDVLIARPGTQRFGPVEPGQKVTLEYMLTNLSSAPIRLLGSFSSCACTVPDKLPQTLDAGESRAVRVRFDTPDRVPDAGEDPEYHQEVVIYTSDPSRPQVTLALVVEVRRPTPSGDTR